MIGCYHRYNILFIMLFSIYENDILCKNLFKLKHAYIHILFQMTFLER